MNANGVVEVKVHAFLNSAQDIGDWSASSQVCLALRERAQGAH
jgi:hypothetical protein